ncbi:MAG: hypothetical protein JWM81_547 [Candidatus Saccharibacteria bacterium]|nr:hypothetical protein [Candidatus Saccharibacteria bacterium]
MGKYLITGRQGSGKTTLIKFLQEQGYTAFNTDDLPDVTRLQDRQTGEVIDWPEGGVDWTKYAWNWQEQALKNLLATNDTVFVGGVVSNQADLYDLFDKVFVLIVDAKTLRTRLETHEHQSHHLPGVIDRILTNHEIKQKLFVEDGGIPISANGTAAEIADAILSQAQ